MDDRTRILVCVGSAVAANCVACFQHYHKEASKAGIEAALIEEAARLGAQVKKGAHITVMAAVDAELGGAGGKQAPSCCDQAQPGCCTGVK